MTAQTKKGRALERLQKALDEIAELRPLFEKWQRDTRVAIANTFDSYSEHIREFAGINFYPFVIAGHSSNRQKAYAGGLESAKALLESMIEEINEYWKDEGEPSRFSDGHKIEQMNTKEVFLVHGRDEGAREKVARFLERLNLKPVVLHEQPNKGRTIIEKFEDYARVGFAVVLLTPDDIGKLKDDEGDFEPRARQNVILELGCFIGQLGRERVCALVKKGVEWPSDYDGVLSHL